MSEPADPLDARERLRIATRMLPVLGLGPYRRSQPRDNVASESGTAEPEGNANRARQEPEDVLILPAGFKDAYHPRHWWPIG